MRTSNSLAMKEEEKERVMEKTKPRFRLKTKNGKVIYRVRPFRHGKGRYKPWVVLLSKRRARAAASKD